MLMSRWVKMEKLSRDECMQLLSSHPVRIGRIALAGPRPVIFPVNYHNLRARSCFEPIMERSLTEPQEGSSLRLKLMR
jgi:hypothetical protein